MLTTAPRPHTRREKDILAQAVLVEGAPAPQPISANQTQHKGKPTGREEGLLTEAALVQDALLEAHGLLVKKLTTGGSRKY
jgi:hypothetical protein